AQTIGSGGAIASNGVLTAVSTLFKQNTAQVGGALYQGSGRAVIVQSTFTVNTATIGGAILTEQNLTLADDYFSHNTSHGLLVEQLDAPQNINVPVGGGALDVSTTGLVGIGATTFFSNTADNSGDGRGGAIGNDGEVNIDDSLFNANAGNGAG